MVLAHCTGFAVSTPQARALCVFQRLDGSSFCCHTCNLLNNVTEVLYVLCAACCVLRAVLWCRRYMRIDAAASRALNVLPQRLDGSSSFSLYGIMARGKTAMGKRLLKAAMLLHNLHTLHIYLLVVDWRV
jgi:hypothetical protein